MEHPIATSQCQATDARRVFPCWDEPDIKATFQTTMVIAPGLAAFSNTGEDGPHRARGRARRDPLRAPR